MTSIDDISIAARAARLKEARSKRFASAADAARAVGLNPVTVRAHENAQNGYPIAAAETYAAAYGVSADWLLLGSGSPPAHGPTRPDGAAVILHQMPNGKARLQINQVLPFATALQILALVQGDEK
jgi:DNA-binding XRE family transcriptional regulator